MANIIPSRPRQMGPRQTFAIVAGQYNPTYVNGLVENTRRELDLIGSGMNIMLHEVPGAFEIPLVVQEIATRGGVDAIIALGVIIEGETAHAALVARAVTDSLQRISLTHRMPVIHEVLLVKNEEQARIRCLGGELNRGVEAARAAVRMVQVLADLSRR
jgi:6,7-dimethyl-8-ribityllumazine synthase